MRANTFPPLALPAPAGPPPVSCDRCAFPFPPVFVLRGEPAGEDERADPWIISPEGEALCHDCRLAAVEPPAVTLAGFTAELDAHFHDLDVLRAEVARGGVGPEDYRERLADLGVALECLGLRMTEAAERRCAVCDCTETGACMVPVAAGGRRGRTTLMACTWVADSLCSACLGHRTPDNRLAGQCDGCGQVVVGLIAVEGWANCPACDAAWRRAQAPPWQRAPDDFLDGEEVAA